MDDPAPSAPATRPARRRLPRWALSALGLGALLVGTPLLLMLRAAGASAGQADCAVVLGARVYADGTPSLALADRTDEAIRLYQQGAVHVLIFSGGIDPRHGGSEAEAMQRRALAAGVPAGAIRLDEAGVNSLATAQNSAGIMRAEGLERALVVSHYYHLPRLELLFARQGVRAEAVPARMTRRLLLEPYFVLREVAAYYKSALLDR